MSRMHWMLLLVAASVAGCGDAPAPQADTDTPPVTQPAEVPEPAEPADTPDGPASEPVEADAVTETDAGLPSSPPPLIVPAETEGTPAAPENPIPAPETTEKPAETEVIEE